MRVTGSNLNDWVGYNDDSNVEQVDNSLLHFRSGPGNPPFGSGSVELDSPSPERYNLATHQFAGTQLSEITSLKFSIYSPSAGNTGGANSTGYLHFDVDFDGSDSWQRRLVYVPSDNGAIIRDTWREWDAIDGGDALWKWSNLNNPWPGDGPQPNGSVPKTWSQLLTDYPDIRIRATDAILGDQGRLQ